MVESFFSSLYFTPKIANVLPSAGILSFEQLAKIAATELEVMLAQAGIKSKIHNPSTWPKQAHLIADDLYPNW